MEFIAAFLVGAIWTAWVMERIRANKNVIAWKVAKARVYPGSDIERMWRTHKADKDGRAKVQKEIEKYEPRIGKIFQR